MTISFGAIGAKSPAGETSTLTVAYPASPGAGQMAIAGRMVYASTATFTDEAGWTNTADLGGGNNGGVADDHTTRVRIDRQVLNGSESGSVTFDQGSGPGGAVGAMARYVSDQPGASWLVASATGTDDSHGADRSATTSGNIDLAPGDMLVAVAAVDTDVALTITSPTLAASGITIGTTNRRTSGSGNTAGQDGNVELFDALVTAGSGTVPVTLAFTTATSQCGPVAIVRLRESVPIDLVVQDATQAQTADEVVLTQVHNLVVQDAAQAQTADNVTLQLVSDSPTLVRVSTRHQMSRVSTSSV